jgi:hypothetical protein
LSVAKEFGFDEEEVKSYMHNQLDNVFQKALMWSNKGISGKNNNSNVIKQRNIR